MSLRSIVCLGLLILVTACGGETNLPVADQQVLAHGRSPAVTGEPWVDYHPHRLTITYAADIDALALSGVQLSEMEDPAASMPNSLLRTRPEYEVLTDIIAGRYHLVITNQVYTGRTNMAAFKLPGDADGDEIISRIRQEFGTYITDVQYSSLGRLSYIPDDPELALSTATSGSQWQIHRMNVPAAWDLTLGSPDIMVATLDTGVRLTHEELANTVINPEVEYPAITANVYDHVKTMADGYGHGTTVASLISAEADNGRTIAGVAPGCRHLPIRIASSAGNFTDATVVEGAYLARDLGADIVSMSIYFIEDQPLVHSAMQDLLDSGVLLIASAGNDKSTFSQYPAAYPEVMSVGGTLYLDERIDLPTWGSNYGPDVEIAAPGAYCMGGSNVADSGADAYREFGGTSAAAPLVAGCAALVWSVFPEMTAPQVRQALINTGAPVTGFNTTMTRPDLEQLLAVYQSSSFRPAPLDQVLYTSSALISLDVIGNLGSAKALQQSNGYTVTLYTPPWEYLFDLSGTGFGMETITFETDAAYGDPLQTLRLPIDNSAGCFPFSEDFNGTSPVIVEVDGRLLSADLQDELYILDERYAAPAVLRNAGAGTWQHLTGVGLDGSACWYFGNQAGDTYDSFELDMAVLPLIDLTGIYDGQLRFQHRYNIEGVMGSDGGDAAVVMVCPEASGVWEVASHVEHGLAVFKGEQSDWFYDRVLLTAYAGERVHVGFLFNSNMAIAGQATGQPAGWWIDDIQVTDHAPKIGYPEFTDLTIPPQSVLGAVPGRGSILLELTGDVNVNRAVFTLNTVPLAENAPPDITVSTTNLPFRAEFEIEADLPNQLAELRIKVFNVFGDEGKEQVIPVYIYNQPGDVNGDGLVNGLDTGMIRDGLWLVLGEAGYLPFMDTDNDGRVTEADASAIGYLWAE